MAQPCFQQDSRKGWRALGSNSTELKLVSSKRKGGSSVTISQITCNFRQCIDLQVQNCASQLDSLEVGLGKGFDVSRLFNAVEDFSQMLTQKGRNNARRSLIGSKTMFIGSRSNGSAKQGTVLVNSIEGSNEEQEESKVGLWLDGRVEQVVASISGEGPVAVLSTSVDSLEGLFVKENLEFVTMSNLVESFHEDQVVVNSNRSGFKNRSHFELVRSDLAAGVVINK